MCRLIFLCLIFYNFQVIAQESYIIAIDPGHGGKDTGAIGSKLHTLEKKLVLDYAKTLAKELSRYPHYQVIMTRDSDIYISKDQRYQKIKELKADLLISIHADSNSNPEIRGASVYTISKEAAQDEKAALSEQKNKNDILKNKNLLQQNQAIANLLIDMVHTDTINASLSLAKFTSDALSKKVHILPETHRFAGFKLLKGVDIPAILIEVGYLSNPTEEKLLNSPIYRKLFIQSVAQGVNQYIKMLH